MTDKPFEEITVGELKARLDAGERPTLIDVREPFEWNISNLGDYGAQQIPMRTMASRLSEMNQDEEIILVCRSGNRSGQIAEMMKQAGFKHPVNLKGGMLAWAAEIDPRMPTY